MLLLLLLLLWQQWRPWQHAIDAWQQQLYCIPCLTCEPEC
jgi:hypothetical protein